MVWFKVDDKAHSNNKIRKVLADEPAALALWTVAGSWSADNLTDGLIPDHQLPWLIPKGADELARKLVAARLWRRVAGGYQFHQWAEDGDGTSRNPTRAEVESERRKKSEAGRRGGLASGRTRSKHEARASADASPPAKAGARQTVEPPTRPDPTLIGGPSPYVGSDRAQARASPPPERCPEHLDVPDPPPCGRCADARRARERHDRDQAAAAGEARSADAHRHAEAVRLAIDACRMCDHAGYRSGSTLPCTHDPTADERRARGLADARAAAKGNP